jgi:hypothetical protein
VYSRCAEAKQAAERKRESWLRNKKDEPLQNLRLHGIGCNIKTDTALHRANEAGASLVPWNNKSEITIDRFDVRSQLDVIPERPRDQKVEISKDEQQLEGDFASGTLLALSFAFRRFCCPVLLNYERFRSILEGARVGLGSGSFASQDSKEQPLQSPAQASAEEKHVARVASIMR